MKKILLSSFLVLMMGAVVFGQTSNRSVLKPAPQNVLLTKSHEASLKNINSQKTLACVDTIKYPQAKEQILGTSNFFIFDLWADDNEAMSQTFLLSGATIGITGVEFYGRNSPNGVASVSVRASVYNVDVNNNPTTEIAFSNITLSDTNFAYRQVDFTPINVTGNYAVVIRPTNVGGIVDFYVNDIAQGQSYDENLSRAKSDYYTSSNGNWVNIPTYTVSFGPFDFEMLAAPKITYTINTDFTASPNPSCLGTPVNFTNATTPTSVLSSRFYNYQMFKNYFNGAPDSTYVYALGGTPLVWNGNTTHTYTTAANHTPKLYTLGGFWNSCLDSASKTVTVNPLPTVTANATTTTVCAGGQITLTGGGASSYTWDNGVTDGVAFTPTATTTYTVVGTDGNNCQDTATTTVTVTTVDATTTTTGTTITANNGSATYQWVDCDNSNQPISGATSQSFTPTATGNYAVVVTENGCSETSACENIIITGINEVNANNNIAVYPNPFNDVLTISSENSLSGTTVKIIAVTGQTLTETTIVSGNTYTFDLNNYAKGLYFVEINQNGSLNTLKVIKK